MARFFSEQEIDGFRDCFYLRCKTGVMTDIEELKFVMRSVGLSPTIKELKSYMKQKENKISFADFLDCAHSQIKTEKIPEEIIEAFNIKLGPLSKTKYSTNGYIQTKELKKIMCDWGEKLSQKEFDTLLKDTNVHDRFQIAYKDFVDSLVIPRI